MILTMIISLFSSILIGLAPCNSNCDALDQENTVEVKRHSNIAKTSGYVVVSPVELLSNVEFYTNFDTDTLYNLSSNGTYYLPYITSYTRAVYYNNIGHSYSEGTDFGYNIGQDISSAYFTYISEETHENAVHKYYQFRINFSNTNYLRYDLVLSFYVDSRTPEYEDGQLFINSVSSIGLFYSNGTNIPTRPSYYLVGMSTSWLYNAKGIGSSNYTEGYTYGYDNGYNYGYDEGYDDGYDRATEVALDPISDTYQTIYNAGKQVGRSEGIAEASANSGVPALIFTGILNVALLPVDIFLQMFQYEVFGINIAGLISGLLTVCMVIVIIRFLFGGKSGGDKS